MAQKLIKITMKWWYVIVVVMLEKIIRCLTSLTKKIF